MKNRNIILLICILVIVIGVVGIFVALELKNKDKDSEKENSEVKEVELKVNDSLVLEADKILGHEFCGGYVVPFGEGNFDLSDLDEDTKLDMVYFNYMPTDSDTKTTYTVKNVEKYFEDTSFLGKDGMHPAGVGNIFKNGDNITESVYPTGCTGAYEGLNLKIIKALKKENELELTYIIFYQEYDYDKDQLIYYKVDNNDKALYDNVVIDDKGNITTKLDYALFNKYVVTFDIKNDNLRFVKAVFQEV